MNKYFHAIQFEVFDLFLFLVLANKNCKCSNGCASDNSETTPVRMRSQCCHQECLGGCDKPADAGGCAACKNLLHKGYCVQTCPTGYLEVWLTAQRYRVVHRNWITCMNINDEYCMNINDA